MELYYSSTTVNGMHTSQFQSTETVDRDNSRGAVMIAVGLIVLLIAVVWPDFPAVTGVAVIAVGTTSAMVWRFRFSPSMPAITALHLSVYSALYLLFVGAVFHAAFVKPNGDMTLLQIIDLGLSIVPMGAAIRIALDAMARGGDAPAR